MTVNYCNIGFEICATDEVRAFLAEFAEIEAYQYNK